MIRKTLTTILALIIITNVFAGEPIKYVNDHKVSEEKTVEKKDKEYKEGKERFWSITIEGGINRFDGDIQQNYNSLIPTSLTKFTFGGSIEYTMTPTWSMGVDYYYLPLAAKDYFDREVVLDNGITYEKGDTKKNFNSQMHNISLFSAFNLMRAFYPKTQSKWGIWATLGLGYAWYHSIYTTPLAGTAIKDGHHQNYIEFNDDFEGQSMYIPVGVLFEYNFTKNLALGTKLQMRAFNKDYIEQRIQHGVTNDFVELATLQLRWKFRAQDDNYHNRNYRPVADPQDRIDELERQINSIVIPVIPDYSDKIDDLDRRLKKLEDILCPDGPDTDGDGVPDCRDLEPDTPEGNQVDFWGRTIHQPQNISEEAFIYFDFDKTDLDSEAHRAIAIAARKMKNDPDLIIEVRGFTDNMGTNTYNADLSQRRANKVKAELVKTYNIDEKRIIANGR